MKKVFAIVILAFLGAFSYSQEADVVFDPDSKVLHLDTIWFKNEIGLNAYPIFGVFGGTRIPNSKVFLQYKYLFKNMNLKASINYSDFLNDQVSYIVGIESSEIDIDGEKKIVDSIRFRHNYKLSYSYDARIGIEGKLRQRGFDIFIGADFIGGVFRVNESYNFTEKLYSESDPPSTIFYFDEYKKDGFRNTSFMKLGFDLVLGVTFNIMPRCALTVQYAPEFVYMGKIKEDMNDPASYYTEKLKEGFNVIPNFVDVILSVRF